MTSNEIRKAKIVFDGDSQESALFKITIAQFNMVKEIAAQLAELNENIKLMQQSHTVLRETDDNDIGF